MRAFSSNPPLSPAVRLFALAVTLVLLVGASQFFVPEVVAPLWPWTTTPFNARFLGATYLAQLVAMGTLLAVNRAAPGRLVLTMAIVFTGVVLVASIVQFGQFDPGRWLVWAWFALYAGTTLALVPLLWRHWGDRAVAGPVPPAWRAVLAAQGVVLVGYGLALLVLPTVASAFWPWPIDALHGRVYSALFVAGGVGALLSLRAAAGLDLAALGASQAVFGLTAVIGLFIVDAATRRVPWGAPGTWLWLLAMVLLAVAGGGLLWLSWRRAPAARAEALPSSA